MKKGRYTVCFTAPVDAFALPQTGRAREFDQNCIVHAMWKKALELKADIWLERVPTWDNISDGPSREEYHLLDELGARKVEARMDKNIWQCTDESALSILQMGLPSKAT